MSLCRSYSNLLGREIALHQGILPLRIGSIFRSGHFMETALPVVVILRYFYEEQKLHLILNIFHSRIM